MKKLKQIAFAIIIILTTTSLNAQSSSRCVSGDCNNGSGIYEEKIAGLTYLYTGEFKNGKFNGEGVFTAIVNGTFLEMWKGHFKDNERDGFIELYSSSPDNLVFEGEFKNNKKNGLGKEYKDGVLIYEGNYKNNERVQ